MPGSEAESIACSVRSSARRGSQFLPAISVSPRTDSQGGWEVVARCTLTLQPQHADCSQHVLQRRPTRLTGRDLDKEIGDVHHQESGLSELVLHSKDRLVYFRKDFLRAGFSARKCSYWPALPLF